jgi:hypothetical protein
VSAKKTKISPFAFHAKTYKTLGRKRKNIKAFLTNHISMELVLTEKELQFLIDNYSKKDVKIDITGINQFTIVTPKVSIPCEIIGVFKKSINIQYEMGYVKHLLAKSFVKLDIAGLTWNQDDKQIEIRPFELLDFLKKPEFKNFYINGFSVTPEKIRIELGILPEVA